MESWDRALLLSQYALEKKAYDLVLIEVSEVTSIADYFIICSGRSDRQVQGIAQGLQENLGNLGISPLSIEGLTRGLEGLWAHAPRVELPEPYSSLVNQFRIRSESLS
jgi:ribosome-associated protein